MNLGFAPSHGLRSVLAVPLIVRQAVIGCLLFYGRRPRSFTETEVDFARKLGATVSLAVDNAHLYLDQQRIAQTLQENFIHELPAVPGLELGVGSHPANQPELVGGDFSDVFVVDDSHVVALIGDVAGKGVRAAGHTETVRSEVRALALIDSSPAFILGKTNELLLRFDPDDPHVTAFLAVLDPHTGHLSYASAGHPAPVHLVAFSSRTLDVAFGPPLGSFEREYATLTRCSRLRTIWCSTPTASLKPAGAASCSVSRGCSRSFRACAAARPKRSPRACATAPWLRQQLRDDLQVVVLRLA